MGSLNEDGKNTFAADAFMMNGLHQWERRMNLVILESDWTLEGAL